MAFQYKNVLESALNKLPSRYSEQILASTCDQIDKKVELANSFFSYAIKPEVSEMLTKSGIELAPVAFNAHTHPANKMIENYLLYVFIPSLLSNIRSVAFFSLRESKVKNFLEMFQVFKYGECKNMGMFNCIIDSKDSYRYGFNSFLGFDDRLNGLKKECLLREKFPKVILCHDELHFWGPEDFVTFFNEMPEVSKLVGTVIFPIEILFGETNSKEPRIYGFKRDGDDLFYFPENESSEGYHQKVSRSRFLFETSYIVLGGGRFVRVSRLKSIFAHHVFSLEVVNGRAFDDVIFFNTPSALMKHELKMIADNFIDAIIERGTFQSICLYLSCLKTPNAASALAKLRQLEKRDLFPDEMSFVHVVAQELSKYGIGADINAGFFKKMSNAFLMILPSWLTGDFAGKKVFQLKIRSLMVEISKPRLEVRRKVFNSARTKAGASLNIYPLRFLKSETMQADDYSNHRDLGDPIEVNLEKIFKPRPLSECISRLGRGWYVHRWNFSRGHLRICDAERTRAPDVCLEVSCSEELDRPLLHASNGLGVKEVLSLGFNVDTFSTVPGTINSEFVEACFEENIEARRMKRSNDCVFKAVSSFLGRSVYDVLDQLVNSDITEDLFNKIDKDLGLSRPEIAEVLAVLGLEAVCTEDYRSFYRLNPRGGKTIALLIRDNHCELSDMKLFSSGMKGLPEVKFSLDLPKSRMRLPLSDSFTLADSMNRGSTGILKSIKPSEVFEMMEITKKLRNLEIKIEVFYSLGFAGSGKSRKVIDYILSKPTVRRLVISPRNALKDDFQKKVEGTSTIVSTFEVALTKIDHTFEEVIIDEISLYPAGYLGLLLVNAKKKRMRFASLSNVQSNFGDHLFSDMKVVLIGDPLQARYFSELDSGLIRGEADIDILTRMAGSYNYLFQTYRMGEWFRSLVEIPTVKDGSKHCARYHSDMSTVKVAEFEKILVPDQASKGDFPCSIETMTYTEAEGLTFDKKALIVVNSSTFKTSVNAIIVAITRSKSGFDFLLHGVNVKEIKLLAKKSILSFIFNSEQIPIERFKNLLPGAIFIKDEAIGNLQEKASNDPFIMPFVNLAEEAELEDVEPVEVICQPEWFKTHIVQFDANPLINEIFEKMAEKEKREFRSINCQSNQFFDMEKGLLKGEIFPMQFSAVFPKHEASDDETFWAGVRKRLHFSTALIERKKLDQVRSIGPDLADIFLKNMPNEFKVTNEDIMDGSIAFDKKRAEKSAKLWENHSERSDIDWNLDRIFLFMKSQLCTKEGKMFTTAKAGQTLACFQHIVLFKFGPMLRAIEKAFIRAVGESFYIHSGKNFFCLDSFVTRNLDKFDGRSIESDYESFDSCQDHVILAFELELMKRLGINSNWIHDYETMKLNLSCRLGGLAIMRFTGEFCTFLFNTFANMLFTFMKYEVDNKRDRILFAGDDMASLGFLKRRTDKKTKELKLLKMFSLKAIEEEKPFPMFCGWYLSPFGILKSPRLLWARICVMRQRGLLESCVDNYLFEAIFAYRLSERLYSVLKEEDIEYHHLVVRFFIKNSKLLKGNSVQLLQEIGEGIGCLSSRLTSSCSQLKTRILRLRQSNQKKYMVMRPLSTQRCYKLSKGLRQMSRLYQMDLMGSLYPIFNYLMSVKSSQSSQEEVSTIICISELCLGASLQCSQIMKDLEVKLSCMMDTVLILKVHILRASTSISKVDLPILFSDQDMSLRPLTRIFLGDLGLELILNVPGMMLKQRFSLLTLGSCIGCQIPLDFLVMLMALAAGRLKPYRGVRFLSILMRSRDSLSPLLEDLNCKTLGWRWEKVVGAFCCLEGVQGREIIEPKGLIVGWLGQPHVVLKEARLEMSLQGEVLLIRRRQTALFLWKEMIDPEGKLIPVELLEIQEGQSFPHLEGDSQRIFQYLVYHYGKYFFGNIALFGTSPNVQFPDVSFWSPMIKLEYESNEGDGKEKTKGLVIGEATTRQTGKKKVEEKLQWNMNLYLNVPKVMSFLHSMRYNAVKHVTLRQVCEPFAREAYDFLKEMYPKGITTNIYRKWPRAFQKAPHVAFDFAHGLNMSLLSVEEKGVIDNMTRRLFKTEGQKSVFEAQSESNIELEG